MYFFGGTDPSTGVTVLSAVSESLFHDSTIYFALISGLLFSALQSRGWSAFCSNKLANVISPYVVMTLLFTWYGMTRNIGSRHSKVTERMTLRQCPRICGLEAPFTICGTSRFSRFCTLQRRSIAWLLARTGTQWLVGS